MLQAVAWLVQIYAVCQTRLKHPLLWPQKAVSQPNTVIEAFLSLMLPDEHVTIHHRKPSILYLRRLLFIHHQVSSSPEFAEVVKPLQRIQRAGFAVWLCS